MGKLTLEKFLNYKKIKDVKNLINDKQYDEIQKIFNHYDTKTIKNRLTNVRDFILNGVDNRWLGRLKIITKKLKNDILSDYSCKIRYGDNWKKKQDLVKNKVKMDKNNFIKKYGECEGIKKWEERNKKVISYGLKAAIDRYGEEEGKKRWERTLRQKISTMYERKKIRPYRNGRTLVEYQEKYGVEDGFRKWNLRNERQKYRFSLEFYISKFGEEQGMIEWEKYCNSMKKTSQTSFIERYGCEIGLHRYNNFVNRIKYVQSEEYFIEKFGEKNGKIKYLEFLISKISFIKDKYSKISQDLFWSIYDKLSIDKKMKCYFYELNDEYFFYCFFKDLRTIKVDFKLENKIIEFDGDYWHSKKEQIKKDEMRDEFLTKKGYIIKRIKENDYRMNKEKIIEDCINFLN